MLRSFFVILIITSFACYFYGICNIFLEVEENACRMTYMFELPQYSRVRFKRNERFPHYGLYYYYEGRIKEDVNKMSLRGAPVIFIPGNGGSYKQVRSLASVALRKAMNSADHKQLNYFAVDFQEELSGIYGEYLINQKHFLRLCIKEVLRLYERNSHPSKSIVLIGHSMGGKVAQAVIEEMDIAQFINTIIFISSPLDTPVIGVDYEIDRFYMKNENFLSSRRQHHVISNETNYCFNLSGGKHELPKIKNELYENIVMVSIGGGNRDLIVRDALTKSKFSDIHAMTSSIPKVWLSCDHLSAVWCLQLVLVINRFLFAICTVNSSGGVVFLDEKSIRIESAVNFFVKPLKSYKPTEVYFDRSESWNKDFRLVGTKEFNTGLRQYYNNLFTLNNYRSFKKLYIEINGYDEKNWLYACLKNENVTDATRCSKGVPIFNYIQTMPAGYSQRLISLIDIEYMLKYYTNWSDILVRLPPTNKKISVKIDAYKVSDRKFHVKATRWFQFHRVTVISETLPGNIHHQIFITDLTDSFHSLRFDIMPVSCRGKGFEIIGKICIPWARGYERFKYISDATAHTSIYVNVPFSAPSNYNSSNNPISLELFLQPMCRYKISYQFSVADTTSRIVQQLIHWLPSHFTSILLIVLKCELNKIHNTPELSCNKPYAEYFQYRTFFIITGCRLVKKVLTPLKSSSLVADGLNNTFYASIIIHSTTIVASIVCVFFIWGILIFYGRVLQVAASRFTGILLPKNSFSRLTTLWPLTLGIMLTAIAWTSCSGVALMIMSGYYISLLASAHKHSTKNQATKETSDNFQNKRDSTDFENIDEENYLLRVETKDNDYPHFYNHLKGLQNVSFHIIMLLLLLTMVLLNFGVTIAWIKSQKSTWIYTRETDQLPTFAVILCLSILLQLDAPHKCYGSRYIGIIVYTCASACILYCQENIYRLKYIIAFVYIVLTMQELLHFLWTHFYYKRMNVPNK